MKSVVEFTEAVQHEIQFLPTIAEGDPLSSKCVVRLIDHIKHAGHHGQHLCMFLEFHRDRLLQFIRLNHYRGIPLNKVREICRWIMLGLDYLHIQLVHERPEGNPNGGIVVNNIERKLKRRAKKAVAKISDRRMSMGIIVLKAVRSLEGIKLKCKVVDFGNFYWVDKDWYNLERSKRVKAFRCGEYVECIEKEKAYANIFNKKALKYARGEDAILHAHKIESAQNGNGLPNGDFRHSSGDTYISLKKIPSQAVHYQFPLLGVLESIDSRKKNIAAVISNYSDSTGDSYEKKNSINASDHTGDVEVDIVDVHLEMKNDELSQKSKLRENCRTDDLFDVPFVEEEK
ncbi:hypothetical protein GIB67_040375 [Kingdonia uniflora]|uniref:non-specific serine/threonine protein kinase n=1 Tax=Kingdonia uniflora TaxID=39325 RepID=A0A7J7L9K0_9MAGN|nr:hypothetical protein GIB67_040375 [Kingdonia uniflora]